MTVTAVPGAGLGLAVARRLTQLQGGRIWVEDTAEGGARFCVELRASGAAGPRSASGKSPTAEPAFSASWCRCWSIASSTRRGASRRGGAAARVAALARRAAEAGNKNAVCDAGVGALLAMSGVKGAVYNVAINVKGLASPQGGAAVLEQANGLEGQAVEQSRAAEEAVGAALGG